MDIEVVKDLLDLMKSNDVLELEIEQEGTRIRLKKQGERTAPEVIAIPQAMGAIAPLPQMIAAAQLQTPPANEKNDDRYVKITAPMVGTFYQAPSPEIDIYVTPGDEVDDESIVCIIEAMKVMNEIKAETTGRIVEVLAENGEAVEYGQPLFLVEPSEPI